MSLEARGVVAGYRRKPPVLTDVSISVPAGTIVGLSGPSGTGKTTLARVLALLDAPRAGAVTIDDQVATGTRFAVQGDLRGSVAMLFQSPRASTDPRLTLRSIIAQPAEVARRPVDVEGVAARVGLTPDLLTRRPYQVSDGQLQRACLARALAQEPRYLICDEATAMLDAATTATLVRLVEAEAAAQGVGVLLISHDEELLAACCSQVSALADLRRAPAQH
ncbi:ABC transporter ATP-binding protein [Oerskovia sp. NPDC060338]|uniref:ABC transporter ATP-binding protein n=1 Tax=Oerskovia sp. NPDC060338 TaxID=3347100 RepID=UPI0036579C2C